VTGTSAALEIKGALSWFVMTFSRFMHVCFYLSATMSRSSGCCRIPDREDFQSEHHNMLYLGNTFGLHIVCSDWKSSRSGILQQPDGRDCGIGRQGSSIK
jgi:hypothetical protein